MIAGRYEPLDEPGLARDTELDRVVRIRWLDRDDDLDDPRLSHPGVVRVYDVGEHDGRRFAAIEHVQGLLPLARRAPLSPDLAVVAGLHAARALAAAHALGLVHAGEILVRDDGIPKLSGFGPGEPGDDVRALAAALNDAAPELPPLDADTPAELVRQLERARPATAATVQFAPIETTPAPRASDKLSLARVLVAFALVVLVVGLVFAISRGGGHAKPRPRPVARIAPVSPGANARQEAENLSSWLARYSR